METHLVLEKPGLGGNGRDVMGDMGSRGFSARREFRTQNWKNTSEKTFEWKSMIFEDDFQKPSKAF